MEKVRNKIKENKKLNKTKRFNKISFNLEIKFYLRTFNKEKQNDKYGFILNKINFLIILYLCMFKPLISINNRYGIIYSHYSYVTFKINSTGNISIFHDNQLDSSFCVPHPAKPDEVYINGVNQSQITTYFYFDHLDNNITYIWKNDITTTICMFKSCSKITEMDFSNFDTSQVTNMYNMFYSCSSLTSLNLTNFNTSKVIGMQFMFDGCKSLKSLDLSYFNTSKAVDIGFMFHGCESLKSLDLSFFDTSQVESMRGMFSHCKSLIILDLSNFNTTKVIDFGLMFEECSSLISLDLSNFKILINKEKNIIHEYIFDNCISLEYINLENATIEIEDNKYYKYIFNRMNDNVLLCSNYYKWNEILNGSNITINCNNNKEYLCFKKNIIKPYYKDICKKCGEDYYQINNDTNKNNSYIYCYQKPQESDISNIIVSFNDDTQTDTEIKTELISNYYNTEQNSKIVYSIEIESISIENNVNYLIKQFNKTFIDSGNDFEIEKGNIKYILTNTENQRLDENKNKTCINLGSCENKLKQFYNISYNNSLYITKIILKEEGMKIPKIEYEVYYPLFNSELIKLNLTICKDTRIDISINVHIDKNLDRYNSSSDYYNNICSKTTSDFGTDISLTDRKKQFIDNNMTLCEESCDLIDYNYTNEKAKCSCLVKIKIPLLEEIKFDKNKLYKSFTDVKNFANINLMKCYKNVFNMKSLKSNYGFFFYVAMFLLFFITLFLFSFKYYFSLIQNIHLISEAKNKIYAKDIRFINTNNEQNNGNILNIGKKKKKRTKSKIKKSEMFPPKIKKEKNVINKKNSDNGIQTGKKGQLKKNKNIHNSINQSILNNTSVNKINKNINNIRLKKYEEILQYNDYELNSLNYEEAILRDKRTFLQYYLSLLRLNHLLIFSFYKNNNKDYNSQIIKIFLFFFFFSVHFTINTLFFNDKTMNKILMDEGDFNFIYQIPQIIYSLLISSVINILIKYLSLSEKNIIKFKQGKKLRDKNFEEKKLIRILKTKFTLFFLFCFFLLFIFANYVSCFCGIYTHTQIHLIKDTVLSFLLSLIYPFGIYLIPGIFRIPALYSKKKNCSYLYKFSQLIQILC